MAIDFSQVTAITIPEGSVSQITDSSSNVLWSSGPASIWDPKLTYSSSKICSGTSVSSNVFTVSTSQILFINFPIYTSNMMTYSSSASSLQVQMNGSTTWTRINVTGYAIKWMILDGVKKRLSMIMNTGSDADPVWEIRYYDETQYAINAIRLYTGNSTARARYVYPIAILYNIVDSTNFDAKFTIKSSNMVYGPHANEYYPDITWTTLNIPTITDHNNILILGDRMYNGLTANTNFVSLFRGIADPEQGTDVNWEYISINKYYKTTILDEDPESPTYGEYIPIISSQGYDPGFSVGQDILAQEYQGQCTLRNVRTDTYYQNIPTGTIILEVASNN